MDEYIYKLSQNNPILTLEVMAKITRKMRTYYLEGNNSEFQKYYHFMREQCITGSHLKTVTAMGCLIEFAQSHEIIPLSNLQKDIMISLNVAENLDGIIEFIFHTIFELNTVYDMRKNQHPLISILKKDQGTWPLIMAKISAKFQSDTKARVLEKLQPFAMYVLCDYERQIERGLQLEMLEIYGLYFDTTSRQKIILLSSPFLRRSISYCNVLLQEIPEMLAYLITAMKTLLASDKDASDVFWMVNQFVEANPQRDYRLEMILLSECIAITPATNMKILCDSLLIMLNSRVQPSSIAQSAVKSALSCWKLHYSNRDELHEAVNRIINLPKDVSDDVEAKQIEYNGLLDAKQFLIAYALNTNITAKQLRAACPSIKLNLFPIFMALLYNDDDSEIILDIIELCVDCSLLDRRLSFQLLPVLLHKLATTFQSHVHLAILRVMPAMGALKENLQTIVMTLKAMANVSPQMHSICLPLMLDLVVVNKCCFPFVEELLTLNSSTTNHDLIVAKAFAIRRMCALMTIHRLENFRKELAIHSSHILAKYPENTLAVGFAFDGLVDLCHGMNAYNTYVSLAERFESDRRERVIVGMCKIMGEIANIPDLPTDKCDRIIKSLFSHVRLSQNRSVSDAAFNAISKFSPDQIALGFPDEVLPSGCIPATSWFDLLHNTPRIGLQAAGNMLIELISTDLQVYQRQSATESHVEPLYMKLPRDNILAELAKYVKKQSSKYRDVDREVYAECTRILAFTYKRPLPAMDWTFLNVFKDDSLLFEYALTIAAHQSSVSNSARQFLETVIKSLTEKHEFADEFHYVFNLLPYLCNTIQPSLMKPFFINSLALVRNGGELDRIGEMLRDANISESNKLAATDVLQSMIHDYEMETQEFQRLLPVLGCAKLQHLNNCDWPLHYDFIDERIALRCLSLHCAMALNETDKPFTPLDAIIDCRAMKSLSISSSFFFNILTHLQPVFEKHRQHASFASWVNEIFVKIDIELAEKHDCQTISFQSAVLVIAIVVGSGYNIFTNNFESFSDFIDVLPYSIVQLLHSTSFATFTAHILESIFDYSMNPLYKHNEMSAMIARKYKQTLLLMRTHNAFNENRNWMKYIEINV